MNEKNQEYLEYKDIIPETILDFKGLKKTINDFKAEKAIDILNLFREPLEKTINGKHEIFTRYLPIAKKDENEKIERGTHNIGIFSTAVCMETISGYKKNVDECKINILPSEYIYLEERRKRDTGKREIVDGKKVERRIHDNIIDNKYGENRKYKAYSYFKFIINGLEGNFGGKFGLLASISTLVKFNIFLTNWDIKNDFIRKAPDEDRNLFHKICLRCIRTFTYRLRSKKEGIHPFELFKFLQFVQCWGMDVFNICELAIDTIDDEENDKGIFKHFKMDIIKEDIDNDIKSFIVKKSSFKEICNNTKSREIVANRNVLYKYFFDEIYLLAKYELYRQMSLFQSSDFRLYDAKRLIYSLIIVYTENKFSNAIVRNKALEIIFSKIRENKNNIWPTGQQVAMSKDGLMIVSDNECVCDLLGSESLSTSLLNFIKELKYIYDGYCRTKRVENKEIIGWYPMHQRDKTPTSWTSAFTLIFIKRFCKLLSLELSRKAKQRFRSNYRKPNIEWPAIYDSSAVKAKIRLMFPENKGPFHEFEDIVKLWKYRTAILFGPPGTGKTTYGRAIASVYNLDYLELTPGDFFSGGENSILITINDIFEHLLHLKNTVVFIDEIDDLVMDREQSSGSDRRSLFVNSLLPRFQELHDKENIILLMATNNIEKVDKAILRMGRVDLVVPVGAISPHGRLKYFIKFIDKSCYLLNINDFSTDEKLEIFVNYLNITEGFTFSTLKHFLEMIEDELKILGIEKIFEWINRLFSRTQEFSGQRIQSEDIIHKEEKYNTRPHHLVGDFQDFGHFTYAGKDFPKTKRQFQEKFITTFKYLNNFTKEKRLLISVEASLEIANFFKFYCNDFKMDEGDKSDMCKDRFYSILTPFYDDVVYAIANSKDDLVINYLNEAKVEIEKMIHGRNMLV